MKIIDEFKAFALKGNVMDLAVAVVIGGAFGKIVTSLVSDILMPLIGIILGGVNFSDLKLVLKKGIPPSPDVVVGYGNFIQASVDFLIIASSVFLVVKFVNKFTKVNKEEKPVVKEIPAQEKLLTEIRDILKAK